MCAGTHVPKGLATAINLRRRLRGDLKTSAPVAMHYAFCDGHPCGTRLARHGETNCSAGQIKSLIETPIFVFAAICHLMLIARWWKKSCGAGFPIRNLICWTIYWCLSFLKFYENNHFNYVFNFTHIYQMMESV